MLWNGWKADMAKNQNQMVANSALAQGMLGGNKSKIMEKPMSKPTSPLPFVAAKKPAPKPQSFNPKASSGAVNKPPRKTQGK